MEPTYPLRAKPGRLIIQARSPPKAVWLRIIFGPTLLINRLMTGSFACDADGTFLIACAWAASTAVTLLTASVTAQQPSTVRRRIRKGLTTVCLAPLGEQVTCSS
jgi:hypothetical protein